jgi:hypothetical protein
MESRCLFAARHVHGLLYHGCLAATRPGSEPGLDPPTANRKEHRYQAYARQAVRGGAPLSPGLQESHPESHPAVFDIISMCGYPWMPGCDRWLLSPAHLRHVTELCCTTVGELVFMGVSVEPGATTESAAGASTTCTCCDGRCRSHCGRT